MSGIAKNTLANRLSRGYKGVHKSSLPTAEIQTQGGLQGVHLLPAEIVFSWSTDDKPDLALAMGKVGATVYMHQLAGFKIDSEAIAKPEPVPPQPPKQELPPLDIRIVNLVQALKSAGMESDPHGKRMIQDLIASYRQNP